jgi:hypothetical protein
MNSQLWVGYGAGLATGFGFCLLIAATGWVLCRVVMIEGEHHE